MRMRFEVVTLLLLVGVGCQRESKQQPSAAAPSASAPSQQASGEVDALLGGLKAGQTLDGFVVFGVDGPVDGRVRIDVERDGASVRLELLLAGGEEKAPVETARYAIYFANRPPRGARMGDKQVQAACEALAKRLRQNEEKVAVPAGLRAFKRAAQEM